jgi:hypothetical protein
MPRWKCCQYGSHTSYGSDHSRLVRLLIRYVPAGVRYPRMPVRVTVGFMITLPPRIAQTVCNVRLTQMTVPAPGLQRRVSVSASRRATSRVVGPARPWAGRMSYRRWNLMIAAQSAADCRPSTVIGPNPPRRRSWISTARWCSPC